MGKGQPSNPSAEKGDVRVTDVPFAVVAKDYLAAGLCVLPALAKQKRPALRTWREYQGRIPTEDDLVIRPQGEGLPLLLPLRDPDLCPQDLPRRSDTPQPSGPFESL